MEEAMNEKTYKIFASIGIGNIVLGIVILAGGIACGVLAIVNGARVLKRKADIII